MVHHQGMGLLAIANLLNGGVVQKWFRMDARVQATELLLQERPAGRVASKPQKKRATKAPTRKEIDRRNSLHQYVLGLLLERDEKFLDALKVYEEAARLDPDAPAVFKAQISLLLAMNREKDALAAVSKVLELDPSDRLPAGADLYDNAISLSGMSKVFGLAGLRLGFDDPGLAAAHGVFTRHFVIEQSLEFIQSA